MTNFIRKIMAYFVKPFVSQYTPGSIGRILLGVTFFTALGRFWVFNQNPPSTMIEILMALFAYVFGSKILDWKKTSGSQAVVGTPDQVSPETSEDPSTAPATSK